MADPHDTALDALLARYVPGSMLDSSGTAELVEQCRRLRAERDDARRVARDLARMQSVVTEASQAAFAYPKVPQ
jgi:hypothetical protein